LPISLIIGNSDHHLQQITKSDNHISQFNISVLEIGIYLYLKYGVWSNTLVGVTSLEIMIFHAIEQRNLSKSALESENIDLDQVYFLSNNGYPLIENLK